MQTMMELRRGVKTVGGIQEEDRLVVVVSASAIQHR